LLKEDFVDVGLRGAGVDVWMDELTKKLDEMMEATIEFIHNCLRMRRMDELTKKLEEVKEATAQSKLEISSLFDHFLNK
jgi:uncharacterized protein YfbU (UPF0304 family)